MDIRNKALLVKIGQGSYTEIAPANGSDFTLEKLYKILDTELIEVAHLAATETHSYAIMIVDEEARFKNKKFNAIATSEFYSRGMILEDIYGDAVICDPAFLK